MKTIINNNLDPRYNLALEEFVLKYLDVDDDFILLWQNENSIIVGRNQNTIEEVNQTYVKQHDVNVVRRITGGGAVYHDLGNLNFSFITSSGENSINNYRKFTSPIIEALKSFGVPAEFQGRNDIVVEGMKISGNAQAYHKNRMLHHGTILFNSDLSMIFNVLNVKQEKIASKSIKSNRARVTNIFPYLKEPVTLEVFKQRLLEFLLGSDDIFHHLYILTASDQKKIQELIESRYALWSWNYGESPAFNIEKKGRYDGGGITFKLEVDEGIITSCIIYGDFLGTNDIKHLEDTLIGLLFEKSALDNALNHLDLEKYLHKITKENIIDCLFN